MTKLQELARMNKTLGIFLQQIHRATARYVSESAARAAFKSGGTMFVAVDCVDGRVYDFEQGLGVPSGCIHYLRMPGGVSPLSDAFAEIMCELFTTANVCGKRLMFLPSLHRARDHAGGCAWIGNDFDKGVENALQLADDCMSAFGKRYFCMVLRAYNTTTGHTDCYLPARDTWMPMHELDLKTGAVGDLTNLPITHSDFLEPLTMMVAGVRQQLTSERPLPQLHAETGFVFTDAPFSLEDRSRFFIVNPYLVDRGLVLQKLGSMVVTCAQRAAERPLIAVILRYQHGDLRSKQLKAVEARVIARQLHELTSACGWEFELVHGVMSHKYDLELGVFGTEMLERIRDPALSASGVVQTL